MTSWVHRYTLRELMDDSFDLFRARAVPLLLAGLLPFCLYALYTLLMRTYYLPGIMIPEVTSPEQLLEEFGKLLRNTRFQLYSGGSMLIFTVSLALAFTAQCRIAMRHVLGEAISVGASFRPLAKPFFSYVIVIPVFLVAQIILAVAGGIVMSIVAALLALIAAGLAQASETLGFILAAVLVAVIVVGTVVEFLIVSTLYLTVPVLLAHEHAGPFRAMSRAWGLATANFKAHFSALYAVTHIPAAPAMLVPLVVVLLYLPIRHFRPEFDPEILVSVCSMAFMVACTGLLACLMALAYIDGRCRQEAYDLQLLAAEIGLGEEFAQAYAPKTSPRAIYPNYAVAPTGQPAPPPAAFPDYSAPPPGQPVTASVAAPHAETPPRPMPGPAAYPDYAAPPPPLAPAADADAHAADAAPGDATTVRQEGGDVA